MGNGASFFPGAGNTRTDKGIDNTRVFSLSDKNIAVRIKDWCVDVIVSVD